MNSAQIEWLRETIINLLVKVFVLGSILGMSVVSFFFVEGVSTLLMINAAIFVYYSYQSWVLYDEIGSRVANTKGFSYRKTPYE